MKPYAIVGPSASSPANAATSEAKDSSGTTRVTSPIASADAAGTGSDSSSISSAFADPTSLGSVHDAPVSGTRPIFENAIANDAPSAAIRKSHAKASDAPAPAAGPLTAAT